MILSLPVPPESVVVARIGADKDRVVPSAAVDVILTSETLHQVVSVVAIEEVHAGAANDLSLPEPPST